MKTKTNSKTLRRNFKLRRQVGNMQISELNQEKSTDHCKWEVSIQKWNWLLLSKLFTDDLLCSYHPQLHGVSWVKK